MEFSVTRDELRLVCLVSNAKCYDLHQDGTLTKPSHWCGTGKRFDLRIAACEFAKMNNLQEPSNETILHYWNSIVQIRHQETQLAKKNKAKKNS